MSKLKIKQCIFIIISLLLTAVGLIFVALHKYVWFCDEWFSFFITNANSIGFPGEPSRWISHTEFMSITQASSGLNFREIIETTGTDVHPPIYYFFLKAICVLLPDIGINMQGFITNMLFFVPMFLLTVVLLKKYSESAKVSLFMTMAIFTNLGIVSCLMLYRMYFLMALFLVGYLILTFRLEKNDNWRIYLLLTIDVFLGFMTQYYFCIYVIIFSFFYCIGRLVQKDYIRIGKYLSSMLCSLLLSTLLFKQWINHIFRGYKGQASMSKAFQLNNFLTEIKNGLITPARSLFYDHWWIMWLISGLLIFAGIILLLIKKLTTEEIYNLKLMYMQLFTVLLTFLAISHVAPANESRYYWSFNVVYLIGTTLFLLYLIRLMGIFSVKKWRLLTTILAFVCALYGFFNLYTNYSKVGYLCPETLKEKQQLEQYADLPWVYLGENDWMMDCCLYDWTIPDKMMFLYSGQAKAIRKPFRDSDTLIVYLKEENAEAIIDEIKAIYRKKGREINDTYLTKRSYCAVYLLKKGLSTSN